ncbi:MAG: DivIVA domain-containing protein [Oscillospiraceae bacterium]|nr:DivIVA domain-containing protein [Oscillospiraceae bacterium]
MINADAIREAKFEKTAVFGYKAEDVDQFLAEVAKAFEQLEEEKADLEEKIVVLAEGIESYREQEESLKTTLLAAQRLSDSLVKEAKAKADEILENAKAQSAQIDKDAAKKRDAAEREINRDMDKERKNLLRIQKEVTSFKANLLDLYKHHLDLITALPEFEDEEAEEEIVTEVVEEIAEETVVVCEPEKETIEKTDIKEDIIEFSSEIIEPTIIEEISEKEYTEDDNNNDDEQPSLFGDIRFGEDFTVSDK